MSARFPHLTFLAFGFLLPVSQGCTKADNKAEDDSLQPAVISSVEGAANPHGGNTPANPHAGNPHGGAGAPSASEGAGRGVVVETMNSGGYTYALVKGPQGQVWAAAPETQLKVGQEVRYEGGMPMQGFTSNTLNRTFDLIYFVPAFTLAGQGSPSAFGGPDAGQGGSSAGARAMGTGQERTQVEATKVSGIEPLKGGETVASVFAKQQKLAGKTVKLRAKVVKYNAGIMGRNWLHIQDGSGEAGKSTHDLTVTTDTEVDVGDTVVVEGTLALNKDFGAGYKYDVIVEEAKLSKE